MPINSKPLGSLTTLAHQFITQHLPPEAIVIDATLGNGHDALFLAQTVGEKGQLYGFDIQMAAIEQTTERLNNHSVTASCQLFHQCHSTMINCIPSDLHGRIAAIMFNLGYLPHGNKDIITRSETTLLALQQATVLLGANGILTILSYPGHPGGSDETQQVNQWIAELDEQFEKKCYFDPDNPKSPVLFLLKKTSSI